MSESSDNHQSGVRRLGESVEQLTVRLADAEQRAERAVCALDEFGHWCGGCKRPIDPDLCWCGEFTKGHGTPLDVGHSAVPMGCCCHYADALATRRAGAAGGEVDLRLGPNESHEVTLRIEGVKRGEFTPPREDD